MKYKKLLSMTLVAFLVLTSVSIIASARFPFSAKKDQHVFDDIGTIICPAYDSQVSHVEIEGEEGTWFNRAYYSRYRPINLPEEFRVDGLKVKFKASVALPIFTLTNIFARFFENKFILPNVLPIRIIEIELFEEPILLKLELEVKETYSNDEPIYLKAILTNYGEKTIDLCDIGLEYGTLDLIIYKNNVLSSTYQITRPVHYIGPTKLPEIRRIEPKESLEVIYKNLRDFKFGIDDYRDAEENFKFEVGEYQIQGIYTSFNPVPHFTSETNDSLWKGQLETQIYNFVIEK